MTLDESPRLLARVAGVFYLLTIVCGVFAELFVRGAVMVRGDAAATAANIVAHESLYRSGVAADLVMLLCYIVVTVLFYVLFEPVDRVLSLLAAFLSGTGIVVLAVNCLNHLAPLLVLDQPAQLQAFALLALRMHGRGYAISGVFFGAYCVVIGWLAFRSRFLPRFIGILMIIGGFGYLVSSFTGFLAPAAAAQLPDFTILGGIAELVLTLWLIIVGVKKREVAA